MSSQKNPLLLSASLILATLLTGCGFSSSSSSICDAGSISSSNTGANFTLVPTDYDVSIYPGGTVQLPVIVEPIGEATGQVTITSKNLPQGLTIDPATVTIGTTAELNVHATLNVASNCFLGARNVFSATRSVTLQASDGSGTFTTQLPINVDLENPTFLPSATVLPVFNIATDDAAPVDSEDDYVDATLTVTDPSNAANNYTGTMGIKGHGNSTWEMPKKPYRLNLDKKAPLMGMTSDSNWILLANYDDKPMLRDDLAFHISNLFGMTWTPSSTFVEVYLNDQYEGVYQLSEKVEVSKARLNIGSIDDTDNSGTDLTGGYIGEIDQYEGETFMMTSPYAGLPVGIADPDPPTTEQSTYFVTNFTAAEASLYAANFADPTLGWRSHWNEDSMVQWFLVNELMGNVDADDGSSDYFYKPRSDDDFYMGPVWDFDVSSGNTNNTTIVSPAAPWVSVQTAWYVQLLKDPAFVASVKAKWTAMRPQVGDLPAYIDSRAAALTPAAANNYARWPTLGEEVWPNPQAAGSYPAEVDYLKYWITQRIAYMDANYLQQ